MGFTENTKSSILNGLTGRSSTVSLAGVCYLGIGTMSGESFVEPSSNVGYARTLLGSYNSSDSQSMGQPVNGNITNSKIIFLPEATGNWGTMTHFALFSGNSGNSPIFIGELKTSIAITSGYVPIFRVGTLSITII